MGVDPHCYELAEWWFSTCRSKRGYLPQDVQELAEQFQRAAEAAVGDDDDAPSTVAVEMWPCNDCGALCLKGDELCGPCYEKQRRREESEGNTLANLGLCEADFR